MSPEKRYQVFISSTYIDLIEERQEVLKAILELGHMPAGMELFPATDETAWDLIKTVIDESDYYVLIIGGRYGSEHDDGIGFTEMEYNYAISQQKPVIALLHGKPDEIPRSKTDTDGEKWKKLEAFRDKVGKKHTRQVWDTPQGLKASLIVSLTATIKRNPGIGWLRADTVTPGLRAEDVLALKDQIADLEAQLQNARNSPAPGSEGLAQGSDLYHYTFSAETSKYNYPELSTGIAWETLFASAAPTLLNEATDSDLRQKIVIILRKRARTAFRSLKDDDDKDTPDHVSVSADHVDTCVIQFRALGLIKESSKKRSVTDARKYWSLTPYGDQQLVQLRALKSGAQQEEEEEEEDEDEA